MNKVMLDHLMSKVEAGRKDRRDYRRGDSRREDSRDMRGSGNVDFEGSMDFREDGNYARDYRSDSRDDYARGRDSRDYRADYNDYHKIRLSKTDMHHWKQMMENEDGTRGPHYDMQQIMSVAEKHNIRFNEFDEKEFCITVNMMYSDYCKVAHMYVAPDKILPFCVDMAKAFLEDEDGPEASEKLATYFHCIVDA